MNQSTIHFLHRERTILHHRIRKKLLAYFSGNALGLFFGRRVYVHLHILSNADVLDLGIAQRMNPMLNGFPLWI